MNMIQRILILTGLLVLAGCGGSGGDSGSGSSSSGAAATSQTISESVSEPATQPITQPVEVTPPPADQTVDDLDVPDGFNYASTRTITLNIDMPSLSGSRNYASVYTGYRKEPGDSRFRPDPDSRLVNTAVPGGSASLTVIAPLANRHLLVEIWTIGSMTPIQHEVALGPVSSDPDAQYQYTVMN